MKTESMNNTKTENKIEISYLDFKKLIIFLIEKKTLIFFLSLFFGLFSFIFCLLRFPIYNTTLLMDLNASKDSGSLSTVVGKVSSSFPSDDNENDQQEVIIKSYAVLKPVVEKLNLDIIIEPKYFPIIGKYFYYNFSNDGSTQDGLAKPFLGISNYVWGGERITINKFIVPDNMKSSKFIFTYLGDNKFYLTDPNGNLIIKGTKNKEFKYKYFKGDLIINVSEIHARPGNKFTLKKLSIDDAITSVLKQLNISNVGKKTDIISLSFRGKSPEFIAEILNSIAESAILQDIIKKQEQAKKTLDFLHLQEPKIRKDLSQAESILHEYRSKSGNVSLDQEIKNTMSSIAFLQSQISQIIVQKGQIQQKYTENSYQVKDINTILEKIQQEKIKFENKLKELPNADQIALNLVRNVDIQNQLYINLKEKIQQFELLKVGTVGNLAVVSPAYVPLMPANISAIVIVIFSILIGLILSVIIILVRKLLLVGIENSDFIESQYSISCLISLNSSVLQVKQDFEIKKGKIRNFKFIAEINTYDLIAESLRSLRTNLSYKYLENKNQIISFTSPSPGVGKSFISANFAYILSEIGKKVLLIDGDIRRGNLIKYFDINSSPNGLSNVLSNKINFEDVIQKTRVKNLDLLPCGNYMEKLTSMIQSNNIEKLIMDISLSYDYVIIDTAPILSSSDTIHFCKHSTISILVLGYEVHDEKEIEVSINKLKNLQINIEGFIFNKVYEKQNYFGNKYYYVSKSH